MQCVEEASLLERNTRLKEEIAGIRLASVATEAAHAAALAACEQRCCA